jgi:thioredoxin-like negative regulator of GroEL
VLQGALPDDRAQAAEALRGLLDQLRPQQARDARLASGRALEALAQLVPPAQGSRLRLDAARAYSSGGDSESARRMLAGLADDRTAPNAVSAGAATTLVSVLIDDGKLDDAARRLRELRGSLPADEYAELDRRIVSGLIRAGELDRADSALGSDSSVAGLALSGQIRLFRGDLRGALERLQAAGPYAGDRIEATHRTALLALLQPMGSDSLPALGQAMLQLERGDTAAAVSGLEAVAGDLRPEKGGAELRLFAGRLARQSGRSSDAERLLRAAAMPEAPATAPAAELALAELMLDQHRAQEAVAQLEHLILTYPESALVPQARRTLDEARGAVPKT